MFQKPWAESTPSITSSSFTSKLPPFPSPTLRHCLPGHTLISFSHCVKTARTASGTPTTQHSPDPEISQKSPLYRHTHTRARHRIPRQVRGAAEFPRRAAPPFQKPLPKPHPQTSTQSDATDRHCPFSFSFSLLEYSKSPSFHARPPTGSNPSRGITRPPPR